MPPLLLIRLCGVKGVCLSNLYFNPDGTIPRGLPRGWMPPADIGAKPLSVIPRVHVHFTPTGSSWLNLVDTGQVKTSQSRSGSTSHRLFVSEQSVLLPRSSIRAKGSEFLGITMRSYAFLGGWSNPTADNLVERIFRQLTDDVVREGSFASVNELVTAINVHLAHHNLKPTRIAGKQRAPRFWKRSRAPGWRRQRLFCDAIRESLHEVVPALQKVHRHGIAVAEIPV